MGTACGQGLGARQRSGLPAPRPAAQSRSASQRRGQGSASGRGIQQRESGGRTGGGLQLLESLAWSCWDAGGLANAEAQRRRCCCAQDASPCTWPSHLRPQSAQHKWWHSSGRGGMTGATAGKCQRQQRRRRARLQRPPARHIMFQHVAQPVEHQPRVGGILVVPLAELPVLRVQGKPPCGSLESLG